MSKYTTGEIAKLCGVTVRTVQYYDTRGILVPSGFSEGGRRLYSESDLRRMKLICFLRELNLPINSIGELFAEEHPEAVISLILDEQEKILQAELDERKQQLDKLGEFRHTLKTTEQFSLESIGDIVHIMKNKKKMKKLHTVLFATGLPFSILQWVTIILWIVSGIWQPFVIWVCAAVIYILWVSRYYFSRVAYICPACHKVFVPGRREAFFARHTPTARKLTCTNCRHHGFCVETAREEGETK